MIKFKKKIFNINKFIELLEIFLWIRALQTVKGYFFSVSDIEGFCWILLSGSCTPTKMDALQQNMANKAFVGWLIQPKAAPLELFYIDNSESYS